MRLLNKPLPGERIYIRKISLNHQGYDRRGRYFGARARGLMLFRVTYTYFDAWENRAIDTDQYEDFVDREDAVLVLKAQYPESKVW